MRSYRDNGGYCYCGQPPEWMAAADRTGRVFRGRCYYLVPGRAFRAAVGQQRMGADSRLNLRLHGFSLLFHPLAFLSKF